VRTAFFDPPPPRILAHRGLALTAPQNSVAAFLAALDAGATHLETDARPTADGHAVLVHDPSLPDGEDVAALPLAELTSRAPHIPTLAEALAAFPAARFNIDVKDRRAAAPVAAAVRDAGATDRVLLTSFRELRRRAAVRLAPATATSASGDRIAVALAGLRLRARPLVRAALAGMDAVQIPERLAGLDATAPGVIDAFHRAGVEVHFWVVNDPARVLELLAAGADGVVTDRADLVAAALS
jgi:glycerophosphoryl diester phosphodiesterase